MTASREEPDAIGFKPGGYSCVIEVKVSRSDFNSDIKKASRRTLVGMGDLRYYLVPEGLVGVHEIPKGWGLLVWKGKGIYQALNAMPFLKDSREELNLFVSCIRRVHGRIQGTSIKHYKYITKSRAALITKEGDQ
jgi:hypothetical protein